VRLAFLLPLVATRDGGTYRVNANYARLIDGLAPHFGAVEALAAMPNSENRTYYPDGRSLYRHSIASPNVHLTQIPISLSTDRPWKKAVTWLRRLIPYWRAIRLADLAYIVMPGLSSLMAHGFCRLLGRPYILYYASEWESQIPFMARWGSERSSLRRIYGALARRAEGLPIRRSLFTLAAGRRLTERLSRFGPRVFETRPMVAIGATDFFLRQDTCTQSPIRALYVGALLPRKGLHFLIAALADLLGRHVPIHLTLVGASEQQYGERLRAQVASLELQGSVDFVGMVNEIDGLLDYYRAADLFVLPTLSEGFPRVVYEAMSQSLPVVTTSIPAIAAAIEDGRQAVLVPPASSEALAEAIERIVTQPHLRRQLIANGFDFARQKLTGPDTSQQILELLNRFPVAAPNSKALRRWARTYYSQSREYRDRLTSKWSEEWLPAFREYTEAVGGMALPGGQILDLGCGAGQTTSALTSAGLRVVGADLSLAALREFPPEKRTARLSLVACDAAFLPFRASSFHGAGSYTMLEHVPDAEAVLAELDRVLMPGASMVICGPNMLSPFHAARLWWNNMRTGRRHPDGTLWAILQRAWWSVFKALTRRPRFLYRSPMTEGLEFAGSDYDAICLVNPFDLNHWLRPRGYKVRNRPMGKGRVGWLLARIAPNLSGGLNVVATKPEGRP
jgi:glycosyltransferase involved in cell wall biosynthesis